MDRARRRVQRPSPHPPQQPQKTARQQRDPRQERCRARQLLSIDVESAPKCDQRERERSELLDGQVTECESAQAPQQGRRTSDGRRSSFSYSAYSACRRGNELNTRSAPKKRDGHSANGASDTDIGVSSPSAASTQRGCFFTSLPPRLDDLLLPPFDRSSRYLVLLPPPLHCIALAALANSGRRVSRARGSTRMDRVCQSALPVGRRTEERRGEEREEDPVVSPTRVLCETQQTIVRATDSRVSRAARPGQRHAVDLTLAPPRTPRASSCLECS